MGREQLLIYYYVSLALTMIDSKDFTGYTQVMARVNDTSILFVSSQECLHTARTSQIPGVPYERVRKHTIACAGGTRVVFFGRDVPLGK